MQGKTHKENKDNAQKKPPLKTLFAQQGAHAGSQAQAAPMPDANEQAHAQAEVEDARPHVVLAARRSSNSQPLQALRSKLGCRSRGCSPESSEEEEEKDDEGGGGT